MPLKTGKSICQLRCLKALVATIVLQFLYLFLYQICINFHMLHPIDWFSNTFSNTVAFYTCIRMLIIIIFVCFYASIVGTSYMRTHNCYEYRFQRFISTATRLLSSFLLQLLIGLSTAWLYVSYLQADFSQLHRDCDGNECLNSRYIFLLSVGLVSSCIHFFKETINWETQVDFSGVQLKPLFEIRVCCVTSLTNFLRYTFTPCLLCTFLYSLFENYINRALFDAEFEKSSNYLYTLKTFARLYCYSWLIATQIRNNIFMIQRTFIIFLSQNLMFPIERGCDVIAENSTILTLADALAMAEIPVLQKLAVYDFYNICNDKLSIRRQQILALTLPGNHPNNWNQISCQCLGIFQAYTEELIEAMKSLSCVDNQPYAPQTTVPGPCDQQTINQILTRQYNEMHGIRRLGVHDPKNSIFVENNNETVTPTIITSAQRLNAKFDKMTKTIDAKIHQFICAIPGYNYLFGFINTARIIYVLSYSDIVAHLCLSLALFCVASLSEDTYGVVQPKIQDIIHEILNLKTELDRLSNAITRNPKAEEKLRVLKNCVNRSLIMLCVELKEFLPDFTDPNDLKRLQCIMNK